MKICRRIFIFFIQALVYGGLVFPLASQTFAEDLAVEWITVTPSEGEAGDPVSLQARITNLSGTAYFIQYGWYLSMDIEITTDDMAVGEIITLYDSLYAGESITFSDSITLPAFSDPDAPSYFGLIIDPLNVSFDSNPNNNTGSASFTFTGDPPHSFADTVGDNYLDVTFISAAVSGDNLNIGITFASPPSSMANLIMGMDLDQNPLTTGSNTTLPGTEAMLSLAFEKLTSESVITLQTDTGTYDLPDAVLTGNTLSYSVPISLVGSDPAMDLFWAVDHAAGPTSDFDRAPDEGVFAVDLEAVVIRRPGDPTIQVSVTDPTAPQGEDEFPDIRQMDVQVAGDQLHLTLTFEHGVDVMDMPATSEGLFLWVDMDSDGKLSTGFANTGQTPPFLGIDNQLRLQIDDLAGIVPELLRDTDGDGEPETSPMGLPPEFPC